MKKIFALLLMIPCFSLIKAQEQFSRKQLADKAFERYEYFKALNLYLVDADKDYADGQVVQRVADCYRLMNDSRNAEQWYAQSINYDKAADINLYYYAEALLRNNKLEEARIQYRAFYSKVKDAETLRFKLATCDSAARWMSNPRPVYKVMAEKKINSPNSDWGTSFYGNSGLVFTSNREADNNDKEVDKRSGNGYLKLYRANKDSVVLLPLSAEGRKTFNGDYHAGPAVFNKTIDTAWITITTTQRAGNLAIDKRDKSSTQRLYTRRLMLIMATKTKNGEWGHFKNFPYNDIRNYSVGHAALSYSGAVLYFTSDMPGGEGKTDIWYCVKQADGSWGKPLNCGKAINTKEEEEFPAVAGQDVLTFASKGLPGMGGFDIFEARGEKDRWTVPDNYRYPVNSTADDFYFLTANGLSGYFSSNRAGGTGDDDIYSFNYNPQPAPVIAKTDPPAKAFVNPPVVEPVPESFHTIIYYDLDKAEIRKDDAAELDKLIAGLKKNPAVKIKLSSYTDVRASDVYNIGLSKRRSEAAIAYLIKQGISRRRISANWFGKRDPVAVCPGQLTCTEPQHQLNRRTEIYFDGVAE